MIELSANDMDSRVATDLVLKACEAILTDTRERFLEQDVPDVIADRYLKRKRTQTARNVLFEMMRVSAMRDNLHKVNPGDIKP